VNEESKENIQKQESTEIAIVDSGTIRDKIYVVRGVQVMLDFELAELYGYETKNFNRQVKNNTEKFEGDDFMFQLTKDEIDNILRCKKFTSSWGGTRYLPYAFTEQDVDDSPQRGINGGSSIADNFVYEPKSKVVITRII